MISVEEALVRCLALVDALPSETIPVRLGEGRMMSAPVTARMTQPPFDASAMDGYALGSLGTRFTLVGEAAAGHAFDGQLAPDQAIRIFTGAPVPKGAVTVVMQEDVSKDGDQIAVSTPLAQANIRPKGQDFNFGQTLPPRHLRPADLGLLAAMNIAEVSVHRRPIVALIATGDELVSPGQDPRPDQIIASNGYALAAMVEAAGGIARMLPIARDNVDALRYVFQSAKDADLIVTIGGASVGDHDLVGTVAQDLGLERAFWKIAMRPGKPLMAGRMMERAMLGLPGNPVSAIVCAHLFMIPMLRAMQGLPPAPPPQTAILGTDVGPTGPRSHYMRARVLDGVITPFEKQDSALLSILTEANALLIRPLGDTAQATGAKVSYIPL
jgi:molybdopterin molybdotransferase